MGFDLTFGAADVEVLDNDVAFQGYFQVRRLTLRHQRFAGDWSDPVTREVFDRGDAVGVLPYDPVSDSLVLIEQFRPGAMGRSESPWMLELIAGVIEPGESDEELVHREAREEADCELSELVPIATFFPSSGACSEQVRLFCGRVTRAGIGEVHGLEGEGEDILVHSIPRVDALELLAANRIPNGHTLIALQWLAIHGDSLRERWA
jgi:ADP-ribose pyrophosphatase